MISVMCGNDFELDPKSDLIADETQSNTRVAEDLGGVSSANNGDGDKRSSSNFISSQEKGLSLGIGVDGSDKDKPPGYEGLGVLEELDNRALGIDVDGRVLDGDEEKTRVSEDDWKGVDEEMKSESSDIRNGGAGLSTSLGYGYEIGDMIWGKVKSHPWWPGHIYNEAFALPSVGRTKRAGHVLVAFFGDSSYGWFEPDELVPFDANFAEKSRQTNLRNFLNAVEEAVDEVIRRRGLGLACHCRNPYNFRPTNVQGYFAVDVDNYELGGVYSVRQIRKARDSFQPRDTVAFVKQLALMPRGDWSIDFIKNKATVLAYQKAVFEEFDVTYAQAFGQEPVRPTRESIMAAAQPVRGIY
ncbi:Tudor/PWWP/MBT superfamily protein [Actinidia rufa]|uniref:Tudor/PWWP/MBT superfamily protein n=1 Tax=Actinidia rufa TaxID=165716 RepID=A0A7J0EY83_9ERIC|nr:Tudor/PWWP/MBT superfamily protein [Actinidia rufa]